MLTKSFRNNVRDIVWFIKHFRPRFLFQDIHVWTNFFAIIFRLRGPGHQLRLTSYIPPGWPKQFECPYTSGSGLMISSTFFFFLDVLPEP